MLDPALIMQPKRVNYSLLDLRSDQHFRVDFQVKSTCVLECSLFKCKTVNKKCILYLHGYNACRVEAMDLVLHLRDSDLCCFDF